MDSFPIILTPNNSIEEVIVLISEYEAYLENDIQKRFVRWIYKNTINRKESQSSDTLQPGCFLGRQPTILWTKIYECHRSGKKRIKDISAGGETGKIRPIQKKSKKIGCPAQVKIICNRETPAFVTIKYVGRHQNHEPGNFLDLQYLPLSNDLLNKIKTELDRGIDHRTIRRFLQKESDGDFLNSRDFHIHFMDIYNIYKKSIYNTFKFDDNEIESAKLWLEKLENKNYFIQHMEFFENQFSFSMAAPWQIDLIRSSDYFCMDATHSITTDKRTILYTLLIRHQISGKGVPVSYMITNDHSRLPISRWLCGLKNLGMSPMRITIDCSIPEINAIGGVFGPSTTIQLCLFHVSRAWNTNLKSKVKSDSPSSNKILWGIIMGELKLIMYEKSVEAFELKFENFIVKWSLYPEFVEYFKSEWGTDEKKKMWSAAYQPEIFTNMATNNYIESWHNQLKSIYLKRQRNRRIDRLIFILTEDVAIDLKMDLARLSMVIGKLT